MEEWYIITKRGEEGPVSASRIREMYVSSYIGLDTMIWSAGMRSWEPLDMHPELLRSTASQYCVDTKSSNNGSAQSDVAESPPSSTDHSRTTQGLSGSQRVILIACAVGAVGMILYPPLEITYRGSVQNMGYGFLLSPPTIRGMTGSVNVAMLVVQLAVLVFIGRIAWMFTSTSNRSSDFQSDSQGISQARQNMIVYPLRAVRGVLGIICLWQLIGIVPVITWLADPATVTPDMIARAAVKVFTAGLFGFGFFAIRKLINILHLRWNGRPHPAMAKKLSL